MSNTLILILFAIPFAVVVASIALQKLLKCPYLVAAIIFSIFLVIGFAIPDTNYIIAGVIYAILSFITAYITMLVHRWLKNNNNRNSEIVTLNNDNGFTTITNGNFNNNNNTNSCGCNRR